MAHATKLDRSCELAAEFQAHGFELVGTGGNCTAYVKPLAGGWELWVTNECTIPQRRCEPITVGLYGPQGSDCHPYSGEAICIVSGEGDEARGSVRPRDLFDVCTSRDYPHEAADYGADYTTSAGVHVPAWLVSCLLMPAATLTEY